MAVFQQPPPLKIKCTDFDCDKDLHCFKAHRKMPKADHGKCRACGADLVDWDRVHKRDFSDVTYTFEALQQELIRHHHFHKRIDDKAVRYARRKGRTLLMDAVRHRLEKYLAPASPPRDGYQTPFDGNPIYYAQHATACCCRTCLAYWHDIPKGRPLTEEEMDYCVELVELYFEQRLPQLGDDPEKVPPNRKRADDEPDESELP